MGEPIVSVAGTPPSATWRRRPPAAAGMPDREGMPASGTPSTTAAAGNQALARLATAGTLHPKRAVSEPEDSDEKEADRIADLVMLEMAPGWIGRRADLIHRRCADCERGGGLCSTCREVEVRRKALSSSACSADLARSPQLQAVREGGQPLSRRERALFEQRFGRDFSQVRIHTDSAAADSARALRARAYTHGPHIVFGAGQYAPQAQAGARLLAHELVHVIQHGHAAELDGRTGNAMGAGAGAVSSQGIQHRGAAPLRRQADAAAGTQVPAPAEEGGAGNPAPDSAAVTASRRVILDALEGYTSGADSDNIMAQFRGKSPATVLAIMNEVKNYGALLFQMTLEQMVDWLFEDVTAEHAQELRRILARSGSPDLQRIIVGEIRDFLQGGGEVDAAQVYAHFAGAEGSGMDSLLQALETAMHQPRDMLRSLLFGELDRANAERLRQLFFSGGGPIAADYAARWTASKIIDLLEGYTSHADSTDIVWNFSTIPIGLRGLVQHRLEGLCGERGLDMADTLMHDMDASDYERLRAMGGLSLPAYRDTRSSVEKFVAAAEWAQVLLEWIACGVVGIATGVLSVAWDIVKGIWDIGVAIYNLLGSLVYLLSFGAAGSENWLNVRNFFIGIGNLFSNPGQVWDQYWAETGLEFHTIEGPFSDCRRAEFIVRKFMVAAVNILLIFVGGYGLAKGAVSSMRGAAAAAELAEVIGVRGVVSVAGRLASRRIGAFVTVGAGRASALLETIRAPAALLSTAGARLRLVLIAAEDAGYWRFLREQAGTAVRATGGFARERLAGELRFWEENRPFWRERALSQQERARAVSQDLAVVEERLGANEAPESPAAIDELGDESRQLGQEAASLHGDVAGQRAAGSTAAAGGAGPSAVPVPTGATEADLGQLIAEELAGTVPEPQVPLDLSPPRPVLRSLREIVLDEIPAAERAYYEAAYPAYVQTREAQIAAGLRGRFILNQDDYVRFRWGRDHGFLIDTGRGPRDLGRAGAIEQEAGHIHERVVDVRLLGSSNTRSFPTPYQRVIPDNLPQGSRVVFLDRNGTPAQTGVRFSARYVADSKYREYIDVTDQTRGFVHLAQFSDEELLVFYIRWQERFPAAQTLTYDPGLSGLVLPVRPWNQLIVSPSLRELAQGLGVRIRLVSDPLWR